MQTSSIWASKAGRAAGRAYMLRYASKSGGNQRECRAATRHGTHHRGRSAGVLSFSTNLFWPLAGLADSRARCAPLAVPTAHPRVCRGSVAARAAERQARRDRLDTRFCPDVRAPVRLILYTCRYHFSLNYKDTVFLNARILKLSFPPFLNRDENSRALESIH